MKKAFLLIFSLIFLCSCSQPEYKKEDHKLKITATIFPQYDFSRQIAGDLAYVSMLLPAGAEGHTFEPTPKDIIKINNSDIFIYTGGESDKWIEGILMDINNPDLKTINLSDIFTSSNEHTHTIDEHYWTSPKNALMICEKIKNVLCEVDYENKLVYENNFSIYKEKLSELDNTFKNVKTGAKRNVLVFGDRFPFKYLAEAYGIEYFSAFPGCAEETEPDIQTVMELTNKVKKENIPIVFYTDFSNHKIANTICEETNAKLSMLRSCHNVTKDELLSNITYIELMKDNAKKIKEALN